MTAINRGMDELPEEFHGIPLMDYARDLSLFDQLTPQEIMYVRAIFMCKALDQLEKLVARSSLKQAKVLLDHVMTK